MNKYIYQLAMALITSLIVYLFSLHVEFITLRAQVYEYDKKYGLILAKLDKIDSKVDGLQERIFNIFTKK